MVRLLAIIYERYFMRNDFYFRHTFVLHPPPSAGIVWKTGIFSEYLYNKIHVTCVIFPADFDNALSIRQDLRQDALIRSIRILASYLENATAKNLVYFHINDCIVIVYSTS